MHKNSKVTIILCIQRTIKTINDDCMNLYNCSQKRSNSKVTILIISTTINDDCMHEPICIKSAAIITYSIVFRCRLHSTTRLPLVPQLCQHTPNVAICNTYRILPLVPLHLLPFHKSGRVLVNHQYSYLIQNHSHYRLETKLHKYVD